MAMELIVGEGGFKTQSGRTLLSVEAKEWKEMYEAEALRCAELEKELKKAESAVHARVEMWMKASETEMQRRVECEGQIEALNQQLSLMRAGSSDSAAELSEELEATKRKLKDASVTIQALETQLLLTKRDLDLAKTTGFMTQRSQLSLPTMDVSSQEFDTSMSEVREAVRGIKTKTSMKSKKERDRRSGSASPEPRKELSPARVSSLQMPTDFRSRTQAGERREPNARSSSWIKSMKEIDEKVEPSRIRIGGTDGKARSGRSSRTQMVRTPPRGVRASQTSSPVPRRSQSLVSSGGGLTEAQRKAQKLQEVNQKLKKQKPRT